MAVHEAHPDVLPMCHAHTLYGTAFAALGKPLAPISQDTAAFWFIALERCCQQPLLVAATGIPPKRVPPERSRCSREHVGSEYIGRLHFQTAWNHLVRSEPDLFD